MIDPEFIALLANYGFPSPTPWPVDENGVVHLLGDGRNGLDDGILAALQHGSEPITIDGVHTHTDAKWVEALAAWKPPNDYLIIYRDYPDDPELFDLTSNGFGGLNIDPSDLHGYIRAFPPGTWRELVTREVVDTTSIQFLPYRPSDPGVSWMIGPDGFSGPFTGGHYWNPYNGMIFFSEHEGSYRVWAPFFCYYYDGDGVYTPVQIRWGYKATGGWSGGPPWSPEDIEDYLTEHMDGPVEDYDDYIDDPTWTVPSLGAGEHYKPIKKQWFGTRMLLRMNESTTTPWTIYDGTLGDFLSLSRSDTTAPVVKQYEDGSEVNEGDISVAQVDIQTPTGGATTRSGFNPLNHESPEWGNAIDAGWVYSQPSCIMSNSALHNHVGLSGGPYPYLTRIDVQDVVMETRTVGLCAFLASYANMLMVGIGLEEFSGGESMGLVSDEDIYFASVYPFAAIRESMPLLGGEYEGPEGWEWVSNFFQGFGAWVNRESVNMRYTALIADDASPHDPRVNVANAAVEEWLSLGDGLCYDSVLGSIPRPRSGASGVLLGQSVDGSGDFAIDVVKGLDGRLMAVMVTPDRVTAWTAEDGVIWDDSYAASIPPPVLAALSDAPPALDLRFLHPDWPTPTGVLTVGGWSLIVTPREREHRRYAWRVPDSERVVRPPFLLHLGWSDAVRFPFPDPRARISFTGDDDGGGDDA